MFYIDASIALDKIISRQSSLKAAVFDRKGRNKKLLFALVSESLRYWPVLEQIVSNTALCQREKLLRKSTLACILVYDFLFGKGIHGAPIHKKAVERHKTLLRAELARIKVKAGVSTNGDLAKPRKDISEGLPRYARVNLLKTTTEKVVEIMQKSFTLLPCPETYSGYKILVGNLKPKEFTQDFHIEELLVFSRKADIQKHHLYIQGHIILQDKASCVPAAILAPPPGSSVIDSCAAPGNKTSHLAAIMGGTGKLFAFERNANRVETLKSQMAKAGVKCVEVHHQDFLKVSPNNPKYASVEYILVDPSCSGSGIVGRGEEMSAEEESGSKEERLEKLANFQVTLLKHALSFPAVRRLVYSTCSIFEQENEAVVLEVLHQSDSFGLVNIDLQYDRRGLASSPVGPLCVRFGPDTDNTNGFFVALFAKLGTETKEEVKTYNELISRLEQRNIISVRNSSHGKKRKKEKKHSEAETQWQDSSEHSEKKLFMKNPSLFDTKDLVIEKRKLNNDLTEVTHKIANSREHQNLAQRKKESIKKRKRKKRKQKHNTKQASLR